VNGALVQLPLDCVGPSRTETGPVAGGVVVGVEVVGDVDGIDVVDCDVEAGAEVVVVVTELCVEDPFGGGNA
jgi:hypothetical protein